LVRGKEAAGELYADVLAGTEGVRARFGGVVETEAGEFGGERRN
jgi:hypothetical protein